MVLVCKLPERIRKIKTVNRPELLKERGEVRGRIDWNQSTKCRCTEHVQDESIFVCSSPLRQYDIDENLVLKKVLWVIYEILDYKEWELAGEGYEWIGNWLGDDLEEGINLRTHLREIFKRNIHIRRIKEADEYHVTDKMINKALCSRSELYREAGTLLHCTIDLMEEGLTCSRITKILNKIEPRESVLFELYCVFELIKSLKRDNLTLKPIMIDQSIDQNQVATLESKSTGVEIKVYHNSKGSLSFIVTKQEVEKSTADNFMKSKQEMMLDEIDTYCKLENISEKKYVYRGRPDVMIEKFRHKILEKVVIGEVKFTENKETALRGLRELFEYIYTAKKGEQILKEERGDNKIVSGFLLVNGWRFKNNSPVTKDNVVVLDSHSLKNSKFSEIFDLEN